jgi:DNA-binding CsgD family transcriptional regulator/tetratricopeptide (TPR) repeat protein
MFSGCNPNKDEPEKINSKIVFRELKFTKNLNIDSLYNIVAKSNDDTSKVDNLLNVYKLSIRNRPIRYDILDEAYFLSKSINYNTGIANSLDRRGVNARYDNDYKKSLGFHKEALSFYENSWDNESKIKNLNSLGVTNRRLNMEEEAIKFYIEALKLSEKLNYTKSAAIALNGIGNTYVTLKKYDNAIKYFHLALRLEKIGRSLRGTGYDYSNLGEAFMYKEQYDSSFYYHSKALEVAEKLNIEKDKAIIYSSIGLMFQYKDEYNQALDYYLKAIPVLEKHNSKRLLSFTLIKTGEIYIQVKNYKKAEEFINKGLRFSSDIFSKDNIISGHLALSDLYESKKMYKEALSEYKLMSVYQDSIFNIKSENNLFAMNIKYESEKKDEKIKLLYLESKIQKGRIVIQFLAIGLLVILTVFFIIFNRMRLRNQNLEIMEMRHTIEEYIVQITKLEEEDFLKSKVDISSKIEEYGLSVREGEVLTYIAQGMKNQEIANYMFVSLSTIKSHTKNIFNKLDVRNRIEAAKKAQAI